MGVPGLWKLLEPIKCPIDLGQLSGKVVAVDMNIWLHQAVKSRAFVSSQGSYLAVLFRRICKLVYFGIRPVFVFDGAVPALKRATMAARRHLRGQLGSRAEEAEQRLIRRLLRRIAEGGLRGVSDENGKSLSVADNTSQMKQSDRAMAELLHRLSQREETLQAKEEAQLFSLPEEQEIDVPHTGDLLHERAGLEYDGLAHDYLTSVEMYSTRPSLDLHSEAFCSLPLKAQLRVVQLARERLDSRGRCQARPIRLEEEEEEQSLTAEDFSNRQVSRLLFRRQLAEREQELSSQLTTEEAASQLCNQLITDDKSADQQRQHWAAILLAQIDEWTRAAGQTSSEVVAPITSALRIQSRTSGHAILVKRSPVKTSVVGSAAGQTSSIGQKISLESLIRSASEDTVNSAPMDEDSQKDVSTIQDESSDQYSSSSDNSCFYSQLEDNVSSQPRACSLKPEASSGRDVKSILSAPDSSSLERNAIPELTQHVDHRSTPPPSKVSESQSVTSPEACYDTVPHLEVTNPTVVNKRLGLSPKPVSDQESSDDYDDFIEVGADEFPDRQYAHEQCMGVAGITSSSTGLLSDTTTEGGSQLDGLVVKDDEVVTQQAEIDEGVDDESFRLDDEVLREEADRLTRQARTTTTRYIEEAQELLRLFGLPFVVSPEEAEAQCVSLQRSGQVDLVASDDSDVWLFGVRAVCRHLFGGHQSKARRKGAEERQQQQGADFTSPSRYVAAELKSKLGLTAVNILRLALLCGSDYTPGIPNVGPVTAVEILGEFEEDSSSPTSRGGCREDADSPWNLVRGADSVEAVCDSVLAPLKRFVDWRQSFSELEKKASGPDVVSSIRRKWLKLSPPRGFPNCQVVRAYLQPKVAENVGLLRWTSPDVPALIKHAVARLGWRADNTEAMLSSVLKQHQHRLASGSLAASTMTTVLITDYFVRQPSKQAGRESNESVDMSELLQSKRLRLAASRLRQKTEASNDVPTTNSTPIDGDDCSTPLAACASHSQMPVQRRRGGARHRGRGQSIAALPEEKPKGKTSKTRLRVVVKHSSISEGDTDSSPSC